MSSLRTILVPHDFSPPSQAAFALAEELADLADARIHLLHVVHPPIFQAVTPSGPLQLAMPDFVVMGGAHEAGETLHKIAGESRREVEVHVTGGLPTDTICTVADQLHADLIVMGTNGREGLSHLLLGSVAERTLRRAPCPVLTVRAAAEAVAP